MKGEKIVAAGPFLGEVGWDCFGWSGVIRHLKSLPIYSGHKFMAMSYQNRYPLYHSFVDYFIPLPSWFTNCGFQQASYDVIGMPPEMYGNLIKYFRRFYRDSDYFELRPPRGHTFDFFTINNQSFEKLHPSEFGISVRDQLLKLVKYDGRDILVLFPRYRKGVIQNGSSSFSDARNWNPAYWERLIKMLISDGFLVVIAGTKNGIPDIDYDLPNLINLSNVCNDYIMDVALAFMDIAVCSITSQSGGTHISMQAACPTWTLGHERYRHAIECNFLKTPCSYLESGLPYSNIQPEQAYKSIIGFIFEVKKYIHIRRMTDHICVVCGNTYVGPVVKDLIQCPNCGLYRKRGLPEPDNILSTLENMKLGYMGNINSEVERSKEANYQLDQITKFVKSGRLYDVGAGNGLFMNIAEQCGFEVYGNELSKFAIKQGKERFGYDLQYGFLEDQINGGYFDVFVLWHTLEHTLNPYNTLTYCYDNLKPNGVVLIGVPIKDSNDIVKRYEELHTYEFNPKNIEMLMRRVGFEIVWSEVRSPNGDTQINIMGRKNV